MKVAIKVLVKPPGRSATAGADFDAGTDASFFKIAFFMHPLFSHSRIGTFETCPRKFSFAYVEKLPAVGQSVETFMGKRVHESLERLHQEAKAGHVLPEAELLADFESRWRAEWTTAVRVVRRDKTEEDYRAAGSTCLARYHRRYTPFHRSVVATEQRIEIALDEGGQFRLQGFIDRIDQVANGMLEVHDYKTSSRLPTQADCDADRQLAVYEMGVRALFPNTQEVKLVWHYLQFDREIRSRRTAGQLEELRASLLAKAKAIVAATERGDFPTRVSRLCDWCDYRVHCPAFRQTTGEKDAVQSSFIRTNLPRALEKTTH